MSYTINKTPEEAIKDFEEWEQTLDRDEKESEEWTAWKKMYGMAHRYLYTNGYTLKEHDIYSNDELKGKILDIHELIGLEYSDFGVCMVVEWAPGKADEGHYATIVISNKPPIFENYTQKQEGEVK